MTGRQPVVVALGAVDPSLVSEILGDGVEFVAQPGPEDLAVAEGAVAEGVLAHALHLVKRLAPLTRLVREDRWAERDGVAVGDLDGATMGIVGYGRIGRRVGELAAAFGMRVLAHDPISPPPAEVDCPDLGELAGASDVLTLHAPLTAATYHLVDAGLLGRVRPGAVLVNCGRGGLLDLDAALANPDWEPAGPATDEEA